MSFESNSTPNPHESYGRMMIIYQQIMQLGRNDVEIAACTEIIRKVNEGELDAAAGESQMQALLDAKQVH